MHATLAGLVSDVGVDGFLHHASATDANQRYLTGFESLDPYTSLVTDGDLHLLVRGLDRRLAENESKADTVATGAEYGLQDLIGDYGAAEARARVIAAFCEDYGVESVAVPAELPLGIAEGLRDRSLTVTVDRDDRIASLRERKDEIEINHIHQTQRATERAMNRVAELLSEATAEDGQLYLNDTRLTSERVKQEIEITLIKAGCSLPDVIVAGGPDAADPHNRGSGPLPANEPIVVDIFPRDRATGYHADMTRTFCVGSPQDTILEWHDVTERALETAIDMIAPGVTGHEVHEAVCDVFETAGYDTTRSNSTTNTGFVHGTGHGVGLEIHEGPKVSTNGGELDLGHTITIEPGLYEPEVGGLRIEDLVVVTEEGVENLTDFPRTLSP